MKIFEDKGIIINLQTLIDSRAVICTNSGGGKSYLLRKILEETADDVMSIILDYEGEFKTLREKFDFLLIGPTGDAPLSMEAAHLLPQKLLELHVSTIIDISDLKLYSRIQYVKKFLDALMMLPRKLWKPCIIVVDEAHNLCGQQEKQDSAHSVIDLMTRGRKRGFCGILATQRIAKLHKDAAAEGNYYFVGRTSLDVDMKRAADILGFTSKKDMFSLRALKPGDFYYYDPANSQGIIKVRVAEAKTTHPKVGIDLRGKITPPTEKIKAMLSKLNDLPKEAEEKAKTLEDLKKQNRELKQQLRAVPKAMPDERQIERAKQQGRLEGQAELLSLQKQYNATLKKLKQVAVIVEAVPPASNVKIATMIPELPNMDAKTHLANQRRRVSATPIKQAKTVESKPVSECETKLNRCERTILSLLYNNSNRTFSKVLVGVFAGYSNKSGGFNNAICHLNSLGLIVRTHEGIAFNPRAQAEAEELLGGDINLYEQFNVNNWAQNLPKCESTIFQFLMQNTDRDFSREEIGEGTGYSFDSGGFNNAICRLNSLGLIIRLGGRIKLNSEILEL